jgi:hypothetical protein
MRPPARPSAAPRRVEQFGALFFANGGSGGGVLKHPGRFRDKEEQDAIS